MPWKFLIKKKKENLNYELIEKETRQQLFEIFHFEKIVEKNVSNSKKKSLCSRENWNFRFSILHHEWNLLLYNKFQNNRVSPDWTRNSDAANKKKKKKKKKKLENGTIPPSG